MMGTYADNHLPAGGPLSFFFAEYKKNCSWLRQTAIKVSVSAIDYDVLGGGVSGLLR
jgi:hypothetical protein